MLDNHPVHVVRMIDAPAAEAAVLGGGPELQRRQHQHAGTMPPGCLLGRRVRDGADQPGIEANRQVRTLLLGAAGRDQG